MCLCVASMNCGTIRLQNEIELLNCKKGAICSQNKTTTDSPQRLLIPTVYLSTATHCKVYNMLMTSQVDYHLLPHASHYSETAVFPIREMNSFADDLHKHLSVLCLPLIPNEFQALTVLFCSLPRQSDDVLS